jgi:hypothetical protein
VIHPVPEGLLCLADGERTMRWGAEQKQAIQEYLAEVADEERAAEECL